MIFDNKKGIGLVIPDIHNKIDKVTDLINRINPNYIIFLGDFFDTFHDGPKEAEKVSQFIVKLIKNNVEFYWCLGNHDMPYIFPALSLSWQFNSFGWSPDKMRIARKYLNEVEDQLKNRITFIAKINNWYFSHAGLSYYHFTHPTLGMNDDIIFERNNQLIERSLVGLVDKGLVAGTYRGGEEPIGGIIWQDWREKEVIEGFNEVVGHTCMVNHPHVKTSFYDINVNAWPLKNEKKVNKSEHDLTINANDPHYTYNVNLDTFCQWYGLLYENGDLSVCYNNLG